jgi:antitoxin (DNA-binding transcriptional repressor) of toxin-antitoxin stability system
MIARTIGVLLLAALASCSRDDGPKRAMRAFVAFQQALQNREAETCRQLLTVESQQVLAELPWDAIAQKQPLQVVGATREHSGKNEFCVDVLDPNNGGAAAQFVVVTEYGRMVVDLVASAGRSAQIVEASGSSEQFEPRQLTPADHERIREYELSQPRRLKAGGN